MAHKSNCFWFIFQLWLVINPLLACTQEKEMSIIHPPTPPSIHPALYLSIYFLPLLILQWGMQARGAGACPSHWTSCRSCTDIQPSHHLLFSTFTSCGYQGFPVFELPKFSHGAAHLPDTLSTTPYQFLTCSVYVLPYYLYPILSLHSQPLAFFQLSSQFLSSVLNHLLFPFH